MDVAEEAAVREAAGCPPATSLPPLAACLLEGCWAEVLNPAYNSSWELRQVWRCSLGAETGVEAQTDSSLHM